MPQVRLDTDQLIKIIKHCKVEKRIYDKGHENKHIPSNSQVKTKKDMWPTSLKYILSDTLQHKDLEIKLMDF